MSKVALITGITGQDGYYLTKFLLKKKYQDHGIKRRTSLINTKRIDEFFNDKSLNNKRFILHHGDMSDASSLTSILNKIKPEVIIHLAWETTPGKFYEDKTNLNWSDATIDLIKKFYLKGGKKFIFSSTCDEYGVGRIEDNIDELKQCNPKTLYGKSKNLVSNFLEKNFQNQSVVLRNFFVCGPGENKAKLMSSIICNVDNKNKINLKRPYDLIDFIDVRDVAKIINKFISQEKY